MRVFKDCGRLGGLAAARGALRRRGPALGSALRLLVGRPGPRRSPAKSTNFILQEVKQSSSMTRRLLRRLRQTRDRLADEWAYAPLDGPLVRAEDMPALGRERRLDGVCR